MTRIVHSLEAVGTRRSVVTIGTFDGVHRGHEMLIRGAAERARELGIPAVIVTFEPIPASVLRSESFIGRICSVEEKLSVLTSLGADVIAVVRFDRELAAQTAEWFVERLLETTGMVELWVGEAFALGRNRSGNVARLAELGDQLGFRVNALARLGDENGVISSSRIRQAVLDGDVATAAQLLGRPVTVRGEVVRGNQLGRTIGYPTANVAPPPGLLPLADGIYASEARLPGETTWRPSMTYIGTRPTVNTGPRAVETHILDFDGDLYGAVIDVAVLQRLRPDEHFGGVEELIAQLRRDEAQTRAYFAARAGTPQLTGGASAC
jgi:riboflavin kinase/FMN adenylyltransferase